MVRLSINEYPERDFERYLWIFENHWISLCAAIVVCICMRALVCVTLSIGIVVIVTKSLLLVSHSIKKIPSVFRKMSEEDV